MYAKKNHSNKGNLLTGHYLLGLLEVNFLVLVTTLQDTGTPENIALANDLITNIVEIIVDQVEQNIFFEEIIRTIYDIRDARVSRSNSCLSVSN